MLMNSIASFLALVGISPARPALTIVDEAMQNPMGYTCTAESKAQPSENSHTQAALPEHGIEETKNVIRDFLRQCNYTDLMTPPDLELRRRTTLEVASWEVGLPPTFAEKLVDTSCHFAETAYGHLPPEHVFFVARYTAYFLYADDLGDTHLDALREFPHRFVNAEQQLDPVLERLAAMIRGAHALWTDFGTSAILAGTIDALTAFYIEFTTCGMAVQPGAVRYPDYLRLKSGIDPPFVAFIFVRGWRSTAESYVQLIPEMEYWIGAVNDVLSFYKEELAQETANYIHLRASVEQTPPLVVLRKYADEILETTRRIERLAAGDAELAALWQGYKQHFLEFQVKAPRYRLAELGLAH
ncbi:terpenoid synthase [Lenzites betulinus]|nr:terpenoid synthase [Lenzites betulinus]